MPTVFTFGAKELIKGLPAHIGPGPFYHSDSKHPSYQRLKSKGLEVLPLEDGQLPNDSILLIPDSTTTPLNELAYIVDRLLGPGGCPWDQEQTHESLKKYLLEEAYEVLDAIDQNDMALLREELGDLLLQPVLHAQMEKLAGNFDIDDVAREIVDKLVRRHPHVFGDVEANDTETVLKNWDAIKKTEKGEAPRSILAGVPKGMASLLRAHEVSKRAARIGFEWPTIQAVFEKMDEEVMELLEALESENQTNIEAELGDLLFTIVNIARWAKVEPEEALRKMLNRFTARFGEMEALSSKPLTELSADEWDSLWNQAKNNVG